MNGMPVIPAWASPMAWVYKGVTADLSLPEAAVAVRACTPDWGDQDHLDMAVAQHALALSLADEPASRAKADACAAAAFMHFAAAGVDPVGEPAVAKSMGKPSPGHDVAQANPSMSANDHMRQAKSYVARGMVKEAMGHLQAAHIKSRVAKSGAKPLGAAYSHARKVEARTGGGKKKQREVANRYLNAKGHSQVKTTEKT